MKGEGKKGKEEENEGEGRERHGAEGKKSGRGIGKKK